MLYHIVASLVVCFVVGFIVCGKSIYADVNKRLNTIVMSLGISLISVTTYTAIGKKNMDLETKVSVKPVKQKFEVYEEYTEDGDTIFNMMPYYFEFDDGDIVLNSNGSFKLHKINFYLVSDSMVAYVETKDVRVNIGEFYYKSLPPINKKRYLFLPRYIFDSIPEEYQDDINIVENFDYVAQVNNMYHETTKEKTK